MRLKSIFIFINCSFVILVCSCSDFLDVGNPSNQIVAEYVYESDLSSAGVLTGIYYSMATDGGISDGEGSISLVCGLYSDEFNALRDFPNVSIYQNVISPEFWRSLYAIIYRVNAAIEGISKSESLNANVRTQLLGEAMFLRAFCYFYLVNFYHNVPLLLTSDYKQNALAKQTPQNLVYEQIIRDLVEAEKLLSEDYVDSDVLKKSIERIRPNKWAAVALLARVYLYRQDWANADLKSSLIINQKELFDTVPVSDVFLKNTKEAIWQLQPIDPRNQYYNTADARVLTIMNGPDSQHPLWASTFLLDALENGDKRRRAWFNIDSLSGIPYTFVSKYKFYDVGVPSLEYPVVLRLAEQYLIRSEARLRVGNLEGARYDINLIRKRAGLPDIEAANGAQIMEKILVERRIELFSEWGHRFLDLKRLGKIHDVMNIVAPSKGGNWETYKEWFAIPVVDLRLNPNLVQNDGYPQS